MNDIMVRPFTPPAEKAVQSQALSLMTSTRQESQDRFLQDAFFKGSLRAGINALDVYAGISTAQMPPGVSSDGAIGAGLLGITQLFGSLMLGMHAVIDHNTPNKMELLTAMGDAVTGIGLFGQSMGGGAAMLPVTLVGTGLSTLGTIGWILSDRQ